jgi:hypothetical protein
MPIDCETTKAPATMEESSPCMIFATCVAEDEAVADGTILYPQISALGPAARSRIYWQCALVSMATLVRCHPNGRRRIYTNRIPAWLAAKRGWMKWLNQYEIELCEIGFNSCRPPDGVSSTFKNAFFKHQVIVHLADEGAGICCVFDADCLWSQRPTRLLAELQADHAVALNLTLGYASADMRQGLSRAILGQFFQKLDQEYTEPDAHWFGGEFLAGGAAAFQRAAMQLKAARERVWSNDAPLLRLPNGHTLFDNDEYVASLAWNQAGNFIRPANAFVARLWTGENACRTICDLDYEVWHLPAEKDRGFLTLFQEIQKPDSEFWRTSIEQFAIYLGDRVGIPERKIPFPRTWRQQASGFAKHLAHRLVGDSIWGHLRQARLQRIRRQ